MLTSARMRSGRARLAACRAASPSSTVVRLTSSRANVMLIACWMVLESSARSRFFGMRALPPGRLNLYKVASAEASFAVLGLRFTVVGRPSTANGQPQTISVIQIVAAAVVHATHPAHSPHATQPASAAGDDLDY